MLLRIAASLKKCLCGIERFPDVPLQAGKGYGNPALITRMKNSTLCFFTQSLPVFVLKSLDKIYLQSSELTNDQTKCEIIGTI
jgi:hypothetical protein